MHSYAYAWLSRFATTLHRHHQRAWSALLASLLVSTAAWTVHADFSTVYDFRAPQGYRLTGLLDSGGSIYATAAYGGAQNHGAILRTSRAGAVTVLHSFDGSDGATQTGNLVLGGDGALYGTTSSGAANGYGTAFRLTTSGRFTTLHTFTIAEGGPPRAGLAYAGDGNFYGVTAGESSVSGTPPAFVVKSYGAIFRMSPSGSVSVLHTFAGSSDGAQPMAALVQASDGNLYGTTSELEDFSGPHPYAVTWGTVFRITTSGAFTTLHTFNGLDGGNPLASLLQARDGKLYGTSSFASQWGFPGSSGTVFSITTSGTFASLYAFPDASGGAASEPIGGLAQADDGLLYGTTSVGGTNKLGSVFRITASGALTTLYDFAPDDSAPATGVLLRGSDGKLLGTTRNTVFSLSTSGRPRTLVRVGFPVGSMPSSPLLLGSDGNLYGGTGQGGAFGNGTLFRFARRGEPTVLHSFETPDDPRGLVQGRDGNIYGATFEGGTQRVGSIFRLTRAGSFSTLFSFDDAHGNFPSPLVVGGDGNFYGTTQSGGANGAGTIFRIDSRGTLVTLHDFGPPPESGGNGALVVGRDGNLYGTTSAGGANPYRGSVYSITPAGVFTTIYSFDGSQGANPAGGLALGSDGNFVGTTVSSGAFANGTLFRITPAGAITTLASFPNDPASPTYSDATLAIGADGSLYGASQAGGSANHGTLFRLAPDGTLTTVHAFTAEGANPTGLVLAGDGAIYGTTAQDGAASSGTIFRIDAR
jgi:uncharacterized repeat protein (TIGR03803 family)